MSSTFGASLARFILALVLSFPVTVILLLSLIVFGITILPYSYIVALIAKATRPDLSHPVTGDTVVFTAIDPDKCVGNLMHLIILNGEMSLPRLTTLFTTRVLDCKREDGSLKFPMFRCTWTYFLGYPFWLQEKNFSPHEHIKDFDIVGEVTLPSPCREEDLLRNIGPLIERKWSATRSPWEFLLLRNYIAADDLKSKTVVIFRHHHGLIDGYGLASLMREFFPAKYLMPKHKASSAPLLLKLLRSVSFPYTIAKYILASKSTSKTLGVREIGQLDVVLSSVIQTDTIKKVKNTLQVSYISILFAIITGALKQLYEQERLSIDDIPTVFPIPKENHPGGSTNHLTLVKRTFRPDSAALVDRVLAVHQRLTGLRWSTNPVMAECIMAIAGFLPTIILRRYVLPYISVDHPNLISCFPSPSDVIFFDGHRIHELISSFGSVPGLGLAILVTGVNGKQRVSITGDRKTMKKICFQRLGKLIDKDVRHLLSEVVSYDADEFVMSMANVPPVAEFGAEKSDLFTRAAGNFYARRASKDAAFYADAKYAI